MPPNLEPRSATRLALLRAVHDSGSISAAARQVGLSYKGAWQILDAMNRASHTPLLQRTTGGSGGGGTRLTARGLAMLSAGDLLARLADTLNEALDGQHQDSLLARLGLQTSARNQFLGRIESLADGAINDLACVRLTHGARLLVSITRESRQRMQLTVGTEVLTLCKAGAILLVDPAQAGRVATPNRLSGTVSAVHPGAVNSEVTLQLAPGVTLHAMQDSESLHTLPLRIGSPLCALINPSDIILTTLA